MAIKKVTGIAEIDSIIAAVHKRSGRELIHKGPQLETAKPIPTGSENLNATLRIGGIPRDRIVEVAGWEGSGKTSFCWHLVESYQKKVAPETGKMVAWVDLEKASSSDFISGYDIDKDQILFIYPESAQEALDTVYALAKTGKIGLIVFDSVDAAVTEAEINRNLVDNDVMSLPKVLSRALRKLVGVCSDNDCCCVFINQFREKPVQNGDPRTTSGGNALRYYSSLRLELMRHKPSKNMPNAMEMRVKVIKSRFGAPRKDHISIDYIYGKGPDPYLDLLDWAKELGVARSAGRSTKATINGEEISLATDGGGAGARAALEADPELFNKLKEACLAATEMEGEEEK